MKPCPSALMPVAWKANNGREYLACSPGLSYCPALDLPQEVAVVRERGRERGILVAVFAIFIVHVHGKTHTSLP